MMDLENEDAHQKEMVKLRRLLIKQARSAAKRCAISYRSFHVGCAVLALIPDSLHPESFRHEVFTGANLKPIQDGPKVCAEQIAVGAARMKGATRILSIVVAGDPQPDDKSKIESKTLHPCWVCRTLFQHIPEVGHDTLIITVSNGDDASIEQQSFAQLLALHDGRRK